LLLVLLGLAPSQEKADDQKPAKPAVLLPPFYTKLTLTGEQVEKVTKLQGEARKKVNDLKDEITRVRAKARAQCDALLTPQQSKLLKALRRGEKPTTEAPKEPAKSKPK
jgi:hypothetical protein